MSRPQYFADKNSDKDVMLLTRILSSGCFRVREIVEDCLFPVGTYIDDRKAVTAKMEMQQLFILSRRQDVESFVRRRGKFYIRTLVEYLCLLVILTVRATDQGHDFAEVFQLWAKMQRRITSARTLY